MHRRTVALVVALMLLAAACSGSDDPAAEPAATTTATVVPATSATDAPPRSTTTTVATTSTSTSSTTAPPIPPQPSSQVLAVVDALAERWTTVPLGQSGYGHIGPSAAREGRQVAALANISGCCFADPSILAGPVGGPLETVAGADDLLPAEFGRLVAALGTGVNDLIAGPDRFVAVGGWTYIDPGAEGWVGVPYSWTSSDGSTWERHELLGFGTLTSVVFAGGRYLAVLADNDITLPEMRAGSPVPPNAIVASVDGTRWDVVWELDDPGDAWPRILRIGNTLALAGEGVELVSTDDGRSWRAPPEDLSGNGLIGVGDDALLSRPDETLWSCDGAAWTAVGRGEPTPPGESFIPNGLHSTRATLAIGDVVVLTTGIDLWVTDTTSPWVKVPRDPVFADVNGGSPTIDHLTVADDGTILAVGAVPSAIQGNKPVDDYTLWTHPPVEPLFESMCD